MSDITRHTLPPAMFVGDNIGVIDAADIPASPANVNGRAALKFPDGADESAAVSQSFSVPETWTSGSGAKLRVYYFGDAAGGGDSVDLEAAFECVSDGDTHDMHASGDYFAAAQAVTDPVATDAGALNVVDIPFTQAQADAIEPGDTCRVLLRRDSDDATPDDYADSIWVIGVDLVEVTA